MSDARMALCPLDGRYQKTGAKLSKHFSEEALIRVRLEVMCGWLRHLVESPEVPTPLLSEAQYDRVMHYGFRKEIEASAPIVKEIETKGRGRWKRTNHDVKACEFYLRDVLEEHDIGVLAEWVHFGCTSEDVNNMAYAMMLRGGLKEILPNIDIVADRLQILRHVYAELPMLARTHGQSATPTTLGKEMNVFGQRVVALVTRIDDLEISVKWNGASGNYNAAHVALPDVDWEEMARGFCRRMDPENRFRFNPHTTQIEPHDTYAELFDLFAQLNTVLIGFCQDIWRYVSDDWLVQKADEGEVGSSAMPHKVNPIDFENAEGNLGLANALLQFFSRKLPISRLQRDLSDSTVERNFGMALGYCLLGYEAIIRGLRKISPDTEKIRAALAEHPEVLTEAYQTILRSLNYPNAYDALKGIARGRKITMKDLHVFVDALDDALVPLETKQRMKALTPETYIGLAAKLARS